MSDAEVIDTPAGRAVLKRTQRRTLAISVLPDGGLELVAPRAAIVADIVAKVEKRLAWIRTQRRNFAAMNAVRPTLRYVNGATHRYLGRQYRLKITQGSPTQVLLRGGYLNVQVGESTEAEVKKALDAWFRDHSLDQFTRRLKNWEKWCQNRKLPAPRLRLRAMAKRWGSAMKDGTICLNPALIRTPSVCVDYVITHEICHLRHPDHGKAFWSLLGQLVPDWKARKQRLECAEI